MNFRHYYKSGDLIKYYDFEAENAENHKPRPAMVLGYNKQNDSLYAMKVTSKEGQTEEEKYKMLGDEIRVPKGLNYSGNNLYGVIKTNNIVEVERKHVSSTLDMFPSETKEEIIHTYDTFKNRKWYQEHLNMYHTNHANIMNRYRENLVAEKLGFFYCHKNKENIFEFIRDHKINIDQLQSLERRGNSQVYSVLFEKNGHFYEHCFATKQNEAHLTKRWSGEKKISDWLREDDKYHILMNDLQTSFFPDALPKERNYRAFPTFQHETRERFEQKNEGEKQKIVISEGGINR